MGQPPPKPRGGAKLPLNPLGIMKSKKNEEKGRRFARFFGTK